jgi:hypothetical protein
MHCHRLMAVQTVKLGDLKGQLCTVLQTAQRGRAPRGNGGNHHHHYPKASKLMGPGLYKSSHSLLLQRTKPSQATHPATQLGCPSPQNSEKIISVLHKFPSCKFYVIAAQNKDAFDWSTASSEARTMCDASTRLQH